jgi:hypothetical protein
VGSVEYLKGFLRSFLRLTRLEEKEKGEMGVGPWNGWVIAAGVLPGLRPAEDNFKAIVRSEMCARLVCATKGNSVNKPRQQWQGRRGPAQQLTEGAPGKWSRWCCARKA